MENINRYQSDDVGVFVALTSLPFNKENPFYEGEIKGLIKQHKLGVKRFFQKKSDDENFEKCRAEYIEFMYKPRAYILFGRYDLAVVSLVDDFQLASRTFRPYNPVKMDGLRGGKDRYFDYHILHGPTPKFSDQNTLLTKAKKTFLLNEESNDKLYPLFGLCRVKINNSLLMGAGADIVPGIIKLLSDTIYKNNESEDDFEVIITESFSYHELTILFFSTSYKKIGKSVADIRRLKVADLLSKSGSDSKINGRLSHVEASLLAHCNSNDNSSSDKKTTIGNNHLFQDTKTVLGYDANKIVENINGSNHLFKPFPDEEVLFSIKWYLKPGHIDYFIDRLTKEWRAKLGTMSLTTNDGDLMMCFKSEKQQLKDVFDAINKITTQDESVFQPKSEIFEHVQKFHTYVDIPIEDVRDKTNVYIPEKHYTFFKNNLESQAVKTTFIEKISIQMRALNMPKVLIARVMTLYSNYNMGIQDKMLFPYYLELRGFLNITIPKTIEEFYHNRFKRGYESPKLRRILYSMVKIAEKAFNNRLFHSHRTTEITDFKLEYRGGIQQILSAYDSAYKALCKPLGEKQYPVSFVYVSGFSGVESYEYAIKLNYFHIFQPSIYLSIAVHEASNFFFTQLLIDACRNKRNDVKSRFNLNDELASVSPDSKDILNFESLKKIYNTVGLNNGKHFLFDLEINEFTYDKKTDRLQELLKEIDKEIPKALKVIFEPGIFHYFMVDTITYYYAYRKDIELFCFWHWHYFIQMQTNYGNPSEIDKEKFLIMLTRILFVAITNDEDGYVHQMKQKPPCDSIEAIWQQTFTKTQHVLERILSDSIIKEWISSIQKLAQIFYDNIHSVNEEAYDIEQIKEELKKGSTYAPDNIRNFLKSDDYFFTREVTNIVYAYLTLIKEMASDKPISVLKRSKYNDGVVDFHEDKSASLLFDPLGGIFTHDPVTRREYFKIRSALMKTLWNFSLIMKKEHFISDTDIE